jgi:hypothetical protein
MEVTMKGIELDQTEFAYMLGVIQADAIAGVDDPKLFPTDDASKEVIYSAGRERLEEHGWLVQVEHSPHEYELNPFLLEAVALIAVPDIVVATLHDREGVDRRLLLHYLADDDIIELSASQDWKYRFGFLSDNQGLSERVAGMLEVTESEQPTCFTISEEAFTSIQSRCQEGRLEQAVELIIASGVERKPGNSFVEALGSPSSGQVVVIRPRSGEIEAGRRARVFGEGNGAWMLVRTAPDSKEFEVTSCSPDSIGILITKWQKELMTTS